MSLSKEQNRLKEIITTGVAIDIFDAEESLSLSLYISGNAEKINDASFGSFFGSIQRYLDRQLILSTVKIFEKEGNRHKIKSIPSALKLMKNHANEIKILDRCNLNNSIEKLSIFDNQSEVKDVETTNNIANYFLEKIPKININKLKIVRDKRIAHHEHVVTDSIKSPTYNEIIELIDFAKEFLEIVGRPYTATAYKSDDGHNFLSSDAQRAKRCLKRLIGKFDDNLISEFQ
jgi:hypothetical protein